MTALLPALEQAVLDESVVPLGHLAKAVSAAARQIEDGHGALLAEGPDRVLAAMPGPFSLPSGTPSASSEEARQLLRDLARQVGVETEGAPGEKTSEALRTVARQIGATDVQSRPPPEPGESPIDRWLAEAKHAIRSTEDALDRAEATLRPIVTDARPEVCKQPSPLWALTEITAAQVQLIAAYASLPPTRAEPRRVVGATARFSIRLPLDQFAGATTLLGMLLLLAALWLAGGLWMLATGAAGLAMTAVWVWRISRATRGVTLDATR